MVKFLRQSAGLVLGVLVVCSGVARAQPPNIVFILADDL